MSDHHQFFVTCPAPFEGLLADELDHCGAHRTKKVRGGVHFEGDASVAYRVCLWSRLAGRVLLKIAQIHASTTDELYTQARDIPWNEHLKEGYSIAIDRVAIHTPFDNSHFAKLRVKDAIVDSLREKAGWRPSIDRERPDLRFNVFVRGKEATVSIDFAGDGLNRRGYRSSSASAPLKENLAAGLLMLADWPQRAARGDSLVDLMCGSGTFLVEGALMAAHVAPGLFRKRFGFEGWTEFQADVWQALLNEARENKAQKSLPGVIRGFDADNRAVELAKNALEAVGFAQTVRVEQRTLSRCKQSTEKAGLVMANPPYGKRLGETDELKQLYRELGSAFKTCFVGWDAFVLSGNSLITKLLGLRAAQKTPVHNGPIECRWLHYPIRDAQQKPTPKPPKKAPCPESETTADDRPCNEFRNRLTKRYRHLRKWAQRKDISCFRVYDADIPQFAVAVDQYEQYACIQEYAPPDTIEPEVAQRRLRHVIEIVPQVMNLDPANIYVKTRKPQRGSTQYQPSQGSDKHVEVKEGGLRFWVNLARYIDTGLFVDQRRLRALIGRLAAGRSFLNLFGYTGTASVYAANGGATDTTTVDLSRTYLTWAQHNFELNKIPMKAHRLSRADCLQWLTQHTRKYGLIFLAPPTFSNSKSMEETFDIRRDYERLLKTTAKLLQPEGILLFATTCRRFRLDAGAFEDFELKDISQQLVSEDFKRFPRRHQTWQLSCRPSRKETTA